MPYEPFLLGVGVVLNLLRIAWWVPNPPFANPRVAEKAPWRSLQSGVAGVHNILEIPADSYQFRSHMTPSSDPNCHFARKALSATLGLAQGARHFKFSLLR